MIQLPVYRLRRYSTAGSILELCELHGGVIITKRASGEIYTIKKHYIFCNRPRKVWSWIIHSNADTVLEAIPDEGLVITVDRSSWFLLERCNQKGNENL